MADRKSHDVFAWVSMTYRDSSWRWPRVTLTKQVYDADGTAETHNPRQSQHYLLGVGCVLLLLLVLRLLSLLFTLTSRRRRLALQRVGGGAGGQEHVAVIYAHRRNRLQL